MKHNIVGFNILILVILLFNSCNGNAQVFGYGDECEKANSIEFAKVIFGCLVDNKIEKILEYQSTSMLGANLAIDSLGRIISVRLRDSTEELTDSEHEKIIFKLRKNHFMFKSCVHDYYFKTAEDELLARVVKNYKGGNVPVYVRFPGELLKNISGDNKLDEIKRQLTY